MSSEALPVCTPVTFGEGKAEPMKHSTGRMGDGVADALDPVQAPMREKEMSVVAQTQLPSELGRKLRCTMPSQSVEE